MLNKIAFFFILAFSAGNAISQKIFEKQFDASDITHLVIYSEMINKLTIVSEKTDKIAIITKITGENSENVVVTASEEIKTLKIGTVYSPFFIAQNDKLAAHKVISVDMQMTIPEFMNIEIETKIASIEASGKFVEFHASLEYGNCELFDFLGDAALNSLHGNIMVHAGKNTWGKAFSQKGSVVNHLPTTGKYSILAESREGDISLLQTK
jgi:hypothetical protein